MDDNLNDNEADVNIKWLRRLVIVLLVVMIVGFIFLIGLFAVRLGGGDAVTAGASDSASAVVLPEVIKLPSDARPIAVTQTEEFWIVLDADNTVYVYRRDSLVLHEILKIQE